MKRMTQFGKTPLNLSFRGTKIKVAFLFIVGLLLSWYEIGLGQPHQSPFLQQSKISYFEIKIKNMNGEEIVLKEAEIQDGGDSLKCLSPEGYDLTIKSSEIFSISTKRDKKGNVLYKQGKIQNSILTNIKLKDGRSRDLYILKPFTIRPDIQGKGEWGEYGFYWEGIKSIEILFLNKSK